MITHAPVGATGASDHSRYGAATPACASGIPPSGQSVCVVLAMPASGSRAVRAAMNPAMLFFLR